MRYIIIILMVAVSGQSFAQGFYSKGATVSISPNTILSVPDSLVNNGTLINNGNIIIAGAWLNPGEYTAGGGQVTFNSGLDQVINHNAQAIEKLVISGGGHKQFLADIQVLSSIELQDGILVSNKGARIIMDQNVTIVGGSSQSHIAGPVERKGTGDWLFPIGNGTEYLPVFIPNVTGASSFGIVTLHDPLDDGQVLNYDNTLSAISSKRYWEMVTSGDVLKSTVIQLPVGSGEPDANDLTIGASSAQDGPYTDIKATAATGNMLRSVGAPTFKYYAIAVAQEDKTVEVFNAISPGSDGKNDFMTIKNIEFYPGNKVLIHNRWGDRVYEVSGYDNNQVSFKGISDNGHRLPSGTYFYSIDLGDGSKKLTGYLVIR